MLSKNISLLFVFAIVLVSACVSQQPAGQQGAQQSAEQGPQQQTEQPSQQQEQGGIGGAATVALKEFRVTIGHTFYSPNTLEVNKGDAVRFLANSAKGTGVESGFSHNHGITIDEYEINQAVAIEDTSNPVVIQFVADKAGTFKIYCKTCLDGPFGTNHPAIQATLAVKG